MGQSTDAVIFYGYCWDDECDLFDDPEVEWPEIIAIERGHKNPWKFFPPEIEKLPYEQKEIASKQWCDENRQIIDGWYAIKKKIEKEFGVDIGSHCSGECSIPYVHIPESEITAHRGYPVELSNQSLQVDASWDERLDAFMKALKIERPHKVPGWRLVSWWC